LQLDRASYRTDSTMGEASLLAEIFGPLHCTSPFSGCDRDIDKYGGIILWLLIMFYMFKALGVICDEYFVPSLEVIVEKLEVSNDVAGATFMAAGSSAPELFTSMVSTFLIVNAGGVGTIVGSAIFNILVMNGVVAFVACKEQELKIWWYPLTRDCIFYLISILELVVFLADEEVKTWEGLIMIATYLSYCLYMKFNPKIVRALGLVSPADVVEKPSEEVVVTPEAPSGQAVGKNGMDAIVPQPTLPPDGDKPKWSYRAAANLSTPATGETPDGDEEEGPYVSHIKTEAAVEAVTEPEPISTSEEEVPKTCLRRYCRDPIVVLWEWTMPAPERMSGFALFSLSIFWIGVCTYVMVDSTHRVGIIMTMPPFVMGLIFLAAGTSIPDTLGSIAVAKQGEGDMAIANALGSNVFDILIGLGVPWTVRSAMPDKEVTFPGQFDDFKWDILILVLALILFVVCLAVNRWKLNRTIGGVLIAIYLVFVLYQLLAVFVFKWKQLEEEA